MSTPNIDEWFVYLSELMKTHATENGQFPHRAGGTLLNQNLLALRDVMDLAKYGQLMQRKNKSKVKAAVAEELRRMASRLDGENE